MRTNDRQFREYLARMLDDVKWENSRTQVILMSIFYPASVILGVIALALYINATQYATTIIFAIIVAVIAIAALITAVIATSQRTTKRKKNKSNLMDRIPRADIYQQYYDMVYPNSALKFSGLGISDRYSGCNAMCFEVNGEHLWWDVKEHTEIRTRTDSKGNSVNYTVYILNYMLRLRSVRLKGYSPITLTTNSKVKKALSGKNNPNEFYSSSITFNQKFKVIGTDQMQMTRLFDPSVVQFLDESKSYNIYKTHPIFIEDGFAYTKWRSGDNNSPWGANIAQFQYLRITKENYVNEITNRIETDFNRFFEILYLFRPFDFYRIYQNKK